MKADFGYQQPWPVLTHAGKCLGIFIGIQSLLLYHFPYNTFYLLLAFLDALFAFSLGYILYALRFFKIERSHRTEVFYGEEIEVVLRISYQGRFPLFGILVEEDTSNVIPSLDSKYFFKEILPRHQSQYSYRTRLKRRGEFQLSVVYLSTSFPVGLFKKTVEIPCISKIVVYPALGKLQKKVLSRALLHPDQRYHSFLKGRSLEYIGVRDYLSGDDPRSIHWKLSARLGHLYTKEYLKPQNPRILVILENHLPSVCTKKDLNYLEQAISFCATLVLELIQARYSVAFSTYFKEPFFLPYHLGESQYFKILKLLSRVEPCILPHLEELIAYTSFREKSPEGLFIISPLQLTLEQLQEKQRQKEYHLKARGASGFQQARRKIETAKRKIKSERRTPQTYLDHLFLQLRPEKKRSLPSHLPLFSRCIYANSPEFQDWIELE